VADQRQGTATTLAMIDLDQFKLVNDRHGRVHGPRSERALESIPAAR
jgi:GGDEF domain-containing protein